MAYRSIDDVLADRRKGVALNIVIDSLLQTPDVWRAYGHDPFSIIPQLYSNEYLDTTTGTWHLLSLEEQTFYARAYQSWYARKFGLSSIYRALELTPDKSVAYDSRIPELFMVLIPPIQYYYTDSWGNPDNPVLIKTAYWMSRIEITKQIWRWVMGEDPYRHGGDLYEYMYKPVDLISWTDCQEFCKRAGTMLPHSNVLELACRAGTTTNYFFGDSFDRLDSYAWYDRNSEWSLHDVGTRQENPFGLYDILGNVMELCQNKENGRPIIRGGSVMSGNFECQSSYSETIQNDTLRLLNVGFRVVKRVLKGDRDAGISKC